MKNQLIYIAAFMLLLSACEQKIMVKSFDISGQISGAGGKYLKYIDMTIPGFKPDSVLLDSFGNFKMNNKSNEPKDFVMYIQPEYNFRVLPCPGEALVINADIGDLAANYTISGSPESERLSILLKEHHQANLIIDSLGKFYMKNQLDPNLKQWVINIKSIADSVHSADRQLHEQFIKEQPGTLASYVALSSKLGLHTSLFNIENDLSYFIMVDTALMNRYDTTAITLMLNAYVKKGKAIANQLHEPAIGTKPGDTVPDIALANLYGDTIRLSSLKGKYVLVNFWGSWCRPCRDENPQLKEAYNAFRYKNFDIYSVALEQNKTDWKNTIREDKLSWKNHVSELNYMNSKVARQFGVQSVPANFLIDPQGIVIGINLTGKQLIEKLNELLNPKPVTKIQNPA
jgi:peroxiredoxin